MFSVLIPSTATLAYKTTLSVHYSEITKNIKPPLLNILAIKSNLVSIADCMNNPFMNVEMIRRRRMRSNRVSRKQQGTGLFFHSSTEFVVIREGFEGDSNVKPYNIRIFPHTGTVQITGVQYPYSSGRETLRYVLNIIKDKLSLPDIEITHEQINMLNYKFSYITTENQLNRLYILSDIFTNIMEGKCDDDERPPFHISFVTSYYEANAHIYVKFDTPNDKRADRCTTVKIFTRMKINIIAAITEEVARRIYEYIIYIINKNKSHIIFTKTEYKGPKPICPELSLF